MFFFAEGRFGVLQPLPQRFGSRSFRQARLFFVAQIGIGGRKLRLQCRDRGFDRQALLLGLAEALLQLVKLCLQLGIGLNLTLKSGAAGGQIGSHLRQLRFNIRQGVFGHAQIAARLLQRRKCAL